MCVTMRGPKKESVICLGSEENEPQINADEREFVASNPSHLIGSWDFVFPLFRRFSCVVASLTYRRVEFHRFGVIIFQKL